VKDIIPTLSTLTVLITDIDGTILVCPLAIVACAYGEDQYYGSRILDEVKLELPVELSAPWPARRSYEGALLDYCKAPNFHAIYPWWRNTLRVYHALFWAILAIQKAWSVCGTFTDKLLAALGVLYIKLKR